MSTATEENNARHTEMPAMPEGVMRPQRKHWMFSHEPWTPEETRKMSMEVIYSGSMVEAACGIGAIVLAILAFSMVVPAYLMPIAMIVLGGGLLIESGAVASRYSRLHSDMDQGFTATTASIMGMLAQFAAGAAGVTLGILSMLGLAPGILLPVAVLGFGGGLVLGSGLTARLNWLESNPGNESKENGNPGFATYLVNYLAAGIQVLIGLGVTVLGIITLAGVAPFILTIVSVLVIGVAVFLSGTAVSFRIMQLLRRNRYNATRQNAG